MNHHQHWRLERDDDGLVWLSLDKAGAAANALSAEVLDELGQVLDQLDLYPPKGLIVRQLRQRWGSMSPASRLLLNRRLIEAPIDAIDYVITHELCHIAVPHHGPEFFELLDRVLPDWEKRKHRLEQKMA